MKLCKSNFIMLVVPLFMIVFASPPVCRGTQAQDADVSQKTAVSELPACPAEIDFTGKGNSDPFLVSGFSSQEGWGRWTDGKVAEVACSLPEEAAERPRKIKLYALGYTGKAPNQQVEISINGKKAGAYSFSGQRSEVEVEIPGGKDPVLRITFDVKNPSSPLSNGRSDDARNLGLGLIWMKFL
jgi:hypothetical protein